MLAFVLYRNVSAQRGDNAQKTGRQMNIMLLPGTNITVEANNRGTESLKGKGRENFSGKLGHLKVPAYTGESESHLPA